MDLKKKIINNFVIPTIISLILAIIYFFIIYDGSGINIIKKASEPMFLYFSLLLPLVATIITSFFVNREEYIGVGGGISLIVFSYIGTILHVKYNFNLTSEIIPGYYREFMDAGSFDLIFIFFGIFFVLAGYGLGFLSKSLDLTVELDKSIGQLSKAKRRKKKRKKAAQNRQSDVESIVDEILKN
jgi:preprotein translocase subunit SecY